MPTSRNGGRRKWLIEKPVSTLRLTERVYQEIAITIGRERPETGGLLGAGDDGVVRHFAFDELADCSGGTYSPNCDFLNDLLERRWNPRGIGLAGFVHSHPGSMGVPSIGDLRYAERILEYNPDLEALLLPIVQSRHYEDRFELFPYRAVRRGRDVVIEEMFLEIVPDAAGRAESSEATDEEVFARVRTAYDLPRLGASRLIVVGVGGGRQFVESLFRAGLGEAVLIDGDIVSATNIATQHVFRDELGRSKVECVAEQVRRIAPQATVVARQQRLDELDDDELRRLVEAPLRPRGLDPAAATSKLRRPEATLLCGFTDSFPAQARVNRLGLELGIPTLCAQVYDSGRGAEITFTYPGVTPACHRCALQTRYTAHLEEGYRNEVTSDGTPIFATERLNSLKGFIALAILHHGTDHPRWGGLLARIGDRNLIQIRMDPDLELPVFERVFGGGDRERILFDDVVWLPQSPDHPDSNGEPACPDCGGGGDLRRRAGRLGDTLRNS